MKNLKTTRHLTYSLVLLAAIATGQAQAKETVLIAENGSERTLEHGRKTHQVTAVELAEGGSERTLEIHRKSHQEKAIELAEGGSERTRDHRRRA